VSHPKPLATPVIGAVLRTAQGASARGGADPVHAFLDGYHTGLLVTIALMAAGVAVSYLRPRGRVVSGSEPTAGPAGNSRPGPQSISP
jgi:hypothetical protein